jgi:hypothetical protein
MARLTVDQQRTLLATLQQRFEQNMQRHAKVTWKQVEARLMQAAEKLTSLQEMERTGGGPDVVGVDPMSGAVIFMDCSVESPKGRRSLCYDAAALKSRKEHKPKDSAVNMAKKMGVELLTETDYRWLQTLGAFDMKTSSWVQTPDPIRSLGGALFCDRRYDTVFLYHNGAESYYAARGFRAKLTV